MNNDNQILEDSIFKIGEVVSVDGRIVRIRVDKKKNTSHLIYQGALLKNISVGGYVKIYKGFTKIVGKVDGEFTKEDSEYIKKVYGPETEKINRILSVSLLGFFKKDIFERGIKELPLVGNECYLLKNDEFNQVHHFVNKNDKPITLGKLALEKGQRIEVGVNSLFASHIGIFGNTGSGKSYTLSKIYKEIFDTYKGKAGFHRSARFFLIDFNGEYVGEDDENDNIITERQYKNIYRLSTRLADGRDKFPITEDALNDANFWIVFLEATEKTQAPFLRRSLAGSLARRIFGRRGDADIDPQANLRAFVLSLISDIISKGDKNLGTKCISEFVADLFPSITNEEVYDELIAFVNQSLGFNGTNNSYYLVRNGAPVYGNIPTNIIAPLNEIIQRLNFQEGQIPAVRLKIITKFYDEVVKGYYSHREHITPLIKRLDSRLKDVGKVITVQEPEEVGLRNFTIVSLKDVSIHIRKIMPLLLCKNLYDEKKNSNNENAYLNLIIDEAHNILSEESSRESEQWKDYRLETFEEIVKEGRKFGVFLTVSSQRPADISATIISQLHNYFLHRLINDKDIKAVEKTISYLDKVSFEYLPILPTGTCILAGLVAQVPVVIDIDRIPDEYEPKNKTMTLVEKWEVE